jgi:hypothetical protein
MTFDGGNVQKYVGENCEDRPVAVGEAYFGALPLVQLMLAGGSPRFA